VDHPLVSKRDITALKKELLSSGISVADLVETAWASASSYRGTDLRGGANGGRLRLAPQKDWEVNEPKKLDEVFGKLEKIQAKFNASHGKTKISMADLIVLGGVAGIEEAAKKSGATIEVPFVPGRTDATTAMTDVESFSVLEPQADGFRNYVGKGSSRTAPELLVDKADFLNLTAPEMAVLLAGMRVLDTNYGGSKHGVLTDRPGTLSNDFFANLIDSKVKWQKAKTGTDVYEAIDESSGKVKWTGTSVDLVMGSNAQLRAIAEVYAADDAKEKFLKDFIAAWVKVMNADRFDLKTK
jgi:catalase-peroxidase